MKIQRGVPPCGVSEVESYSYFATGGIAYVNGTKFTNDDTLNVTPTISWLQKILGWKYLTLVLGILVTLLAIPVVVGIVQWARRLAHRYGSRGGGSSSSRRYPPPSRPHVMGRGLSETFSNQALITTDTFSHHVLPIEWSCAICTFLNSPQLGYCEMCGQPRDVTVVELSPGTITPTTTTTRALM